MTIITDAQSLRGDVFIGRHPISHDPSDRLGRVARSSSISQLLLIVTGLRCCFSAVCKCMPEQQAHGFCDTAGTPTPAPRRGGEA